MMGMIAGSATANTGATGTFTIPLMIKAGYKRHVAGAIEPAASTGGMFMPPIMGAGVFIMAEMIRVPYTEIMVVRSEEHTSELQSLMRLSYAVFCLKKKKNN